MDNGFKNDNFNIPEEQPNISNQEHNVNNNFNYRSDEEALRNMNRSYGQAANNPTLEGCSPERGQHVNQAQNGFYGSGQQNCSDHNTRYYQQPHQYGYNNQNGYYQPQQCNFQNPYEDNARFGEYRRDPNSIYAEMKKDKKEKRGASKGFVALAVSVGMILCLLIGTFSTSYYYRLMQNNKPQFAGSNVNIEYESSEKTPEITNKGTAAYVASKSLQTVVEVRTETVSTDTYYGQYVTEGAGSGVIISSGDAGTYIITCAHVIDGATKVFVTTSDGKEYESSFTAADSQTDIGIIKIDVKGLQAAHPYLSDIVIGEEVVAIGNPLGELGGSVTNGIISALDRDIIIDGTTYHLLQTNAEINPGNSGGGLFNMEGNLIGIVNAKSAGENVEGLGFAIPIDDAMEIATELIENGYVTGRVQLGFTLLHVDSKEVVYKYWQYSRYFTEFGIYILESQSKDFMVGDRLLAINSRTVSTIPEIKALLLDFEVGEKVTLTVSRLNSRNQSEILNIDLVLTEMTNQTS